MTAETPQSNAMPDGIGPWLQWAGLSVVGLTALALLAAQAPSRVRLLGLFAILLGMIGGWMLGLLAGQFAIPRTGKAVLIFFGLLIATMQVGVTLETWRKYRAVQQDNYDIAVRQHHKAVFAQSRNLFEAQSNWTEKQTAKLRELFAEAKREREAALEEQKKQLDEEFVEQSRFSYFLTARLSGVTQRFSDESDLPDFVGIAFWLIEIALGVTAGLFVFRQTGDAQKNTAASA